MSSRATPAAMTKMPSGHHNQKAVATPTRMIIVTKRAKNPRA